MIDPKNGHRREAGGAAEDPRLLRRLVSAALAARARRTPVALRRLRARSAPHLRFVERSAPQARARELPRHGGLPGQDGAQAGLPLPLRRRRDGALRDGRRRSAHARQLQRRPARPRREQALELADLFCRSARRKVRRLVPRPLEQRRRRARTSVAASVMKGEHEWLLEGGCRWAGSRRISARTPSLNGRPPATPPKVAAAS